MTDIMDTVTQNVNVITILWTVNSEAKSTMPISAMMIFISLCELQEQENEG